MPPSQQKAQTDLTPGPAPSPSHGRAARMPVQPASTRMHTARSVVGRDPCASKAERRSTPPCAAGAMARQRRPDVPWESIEVMLRGSPLLKFGRQGDPHFR